MNQDPSRKRLGRGLAALIGEMDKPAEQASKPAVGADGRLPIDLIDPNPRNPRRSFAEGRAFGDLAQSIREHGIVQPVVVRPTGREGRHEIIAGERRWRAAQKAGLTEVPVIIRDVSDRVALELAIVENVQRADLNPIEEAAGLPAADRRAQLTRSPIWGRSSGKSRSHVANTLRLLKLFGWNQGHAGRRCALRRPCPRRLFDREGSGGTCQAHCRRQSPGAPAEMLAQQPEGSRQGRHSSSTPASGKGCPDTLALERCCPTPGRQNRGHQPQEPGRRNSHCLQVLWSSLTNSCRRLQPRLYLATERQAPVNHRGGSSAAAGRQA